MTLRRDICDFCALKLDRDLLPFTRLALIVLLDVLIADPECTALPPRDMTGSEVEGRGT